MVSNSLGPALQELLDALQQMAREYADDDEEYKALRSAMPEEFPF